MKQQCPLENPTSLKLMDRFRSRFAKHFGSALANIDRGAFVRSDEFIQLYEFVGVKAPEYGVTATHGPSGSVNSSESSQPSHKQCVVEMPDPAY